MSTDQNSPRPAQAGSSIGLRRSVKVIAVLVVVLFLVGEGLTELWYRLHEERASRNPEWSFRWPDEGPSKPQPFQEFKVVGEELLHFDRARGAAWLDADRNQWMVTLLEWDPGKKVSAMDSRHNPMICLPGVGLELVSELGMTDVPTSAGTIAFRSYEFRRDNRTPFVFSAVIRPLQIKESTLRPGKWERRITQFEKALYGNRQSPERILLIAIDGPRDAEAARKILIKEFPQFVISKSTTLSVK
jgi:hypothetical protein